MPLILLHVHFFFYGVAAQHGLWPPNSWWGSRSHNKAPQSVGLLWMSDQLVAETSTWQHTNLTTNIHAPGGIWTHNLSRRAAADLRLRPRGHWHRRSWSYSVVNKILKRQTVKYNELYRHECISVSEVFVVARWILNGFAEFVCGCTSYFPSGVHWCMV